MTFPGFPGEWSRAPVDVSRLRCDTAQRSDADTFPAADRTAADTEDIDQSDSDEVHTRRGDSPADDWHRPVTHASIDWVQRDMQRFFTKLTKSRF